MKNLTVSQDALGRHVAFACKIEHEAPAPNREGIGIRCGIATTLAPFIGEMPTVPTSLGWIEAQKRTAQRDTRLERSSNRRRRAQRRVVVLQARQARIRRDFPYRAALDIALRFGVAVLEGLSTRGMAASAKGPLTEPGRNVRGKTVLDRVILNAGWQQFATMLSYEMEERGGQVETVPARFISQTCALCGEDTRSRESRARFTCTSCGHTDHAEINAKIAI